jgi:hypothetical protein
MERLVCLVNGDMIGNGTVLQDKESLGVASIKIGYWMVRRQRQDKDKEQWDIRISNTCTRKALDQDVERSIATVFVFALAIGITALYIAAQGYK